MYPNDKEGVIDKKYANWLIKNVPNSKTLNLKKFMYLGSNYKKDEKYEKISGDCLEALIGAIFVDSSLKNAEKFILSSEIFA